VPQLKSLCVHQDIFLNHPIFSASLQAEQDAKDAEQWLSNPELRCVPDTLMELKIRAMVYDIGQLHNHPEGPTRRQTPFRPLLRELSPSSHYQTISVSITAGGLLETFNRDLALSSLVDACNDLHVLDPKEASLEIESTFSGSTKKIDNLVSPLYFPSSSE
jgi:hypothetical protein